MMIRLQTFLFLVISIITVSVFAGAGANFTFNIKAGTQLPKTVVQGSSVRAYYTITNNIGKPLPGFSVKYYAPNVTPVTHDPTISDLCPVDGSHPWPITPCTVEFNIFGPVVNGGFSIANGPSITQLDDPAKKLNVSLAQPDGQVTATPVTLSFATRSGTTVIKNTATNAFATVSLKISELQNISISYADCPDYPVFFPGESCSVRFTAADNATVGTGNIIVSYQYGSNTPSATSASITVNPGSLEINSGAPVNLPPTTYTAIPVQVKNNSFAISGGLTYSLPWDNNNEVSVDLNDCNSTLSANGICTLLISTDHASVGETSTLQVSGSTGVPTGSVPVSITAVKAEPVVFNAPGQEFLNLDNQSTSDVVTITNVTLTSTGTPTGITPTTNIPIPSDCINYTGSTCSIPFDATTEANIVNGMLTVTYTTDKGGSYIVQAPLVVNNAVTVTINPDNSGNSQPMYLSYNNTVNPPTNASFTVKVAGNFAWNATNNLNLNHSLQDTDYSTTCTGYILSPQTCSVTFVTHANSQFGDSAQLIATGNVAPNSGQQNVYVGIPLVGIGQDGSSAGASLIDYNNTSTWSEQDTTDTSTTLYGAVMNEQAWVTVGTNTNNNHSVIRYASGKGQNWQSATITPSSIGWLYSVAADAGANNWVAVGSNMSGHPLIAISSNASTWNSSSLNGQGYLHAVANSNATWIAVGTTATNPFDANGSQLINVSNNNGASWGNPIVLNAGILNGIATNGTGTWIAVGTTHNADSSSNQVILVSTDDGVSWSPATGFTTPGGALFSVAWNGSAWVAVGTDTSVPPNEIIIVSTDGQHWSSPIPLPSGAGKGILYGVAWNGNTWVAVGANADGTAADIYTSTAPIPEQDDNWNVPNNVIDTFSILYGVAAYQLPAGENISPVSPVPQSQDTNTQNKKRRCISVLSMKLFC